MKIPSRAQVDAFCGSRATRYQRIAGVLAPAILLASILYILIVWHTLPERIPSHYNMAGEIDGYGSRATLLLMPVIGLVVDLSVALAGRFPKSWNTGVRINSLNRVRVYRLVRDLMADLRLACALIFVFLPLWQTALPARMPGEIVTGVMLVLVLAPLLRYLLRLRRAR